MKILKKIKSIITNNAPVSRKYFNKQIKNYHDKKINLEKQLTDVSLLIKDLSNKVDNLEKNIIENINKREDDLRKFIINNYEKKYESFIDNERQKQEKEKLFANIKWQAKGKRIWIIKTAIPNNDYGKLWGDYYFALSLKKNLEKLNVFVLIDNKENLYEGLDNDVTLVLRGNNYYIPDRRTNNAKYILWNISHPSEVSIEEYNMYDIVCVGSIKYADILKTKIDVPVYPLLQCTDTDIFYPDNNKKRKKYDYIFVGNTRGIKRECVDWALDNNVDISVWGKGWEKCFDNYNDFLVSDHILNDNLPNLYNSSKVTFNDHWQDMKDYNFINNRIFDALACGLPIISDYVSELEELFGDVILIYKNEKEFIECINKVNKDYKSIRKKILDKGALIRKKYSFEARAKELLEIAERK